MDFLLCGFVLSMIFVTSLGTVGALLSSSFPPWESYRGVVGVFLFLFAFGFYSGIVSKLMLMYKPFKCGVYAMDNPIFTYWKLFTVVNEFGRGAWLPFSVVFAKPLIAIWFGAKVGKDIALGGRLVDPHLICIGDEAIIGQDSIITAHVITSGAITLARVKNRESSDSRGQRRNHGRGRVRRGLRCRGRIGGGAEYQDPGA